MSNEYFIITFVSVITSTKFINKFNYNMEETI